MTEAEYQEHLKANERKRAKLNGKEQANENQKAEISLVLTSSAL